METTIPVGGSDIRAHTDSYIGITPVNIYISTVVYIYISSAVINICSVSAIVFNI